jgi:uncharacterized membrane protein
VYFYLQMIQNMTSEYLKLYQKIEGMKQTPETEQLKKQIKEDLYQKLRFSFLDFMSIGRVIGYDELKTEMLKAVELIEQQKKFDNL